MIRISRMCSTSLYIVVAGVFCIEDVSSANILGIIPFPMVSHYQVANPIYLELAKRGHNVTVLSPKSEKNPPQNYQQIKLDNFEPGLVLNPEDTEPDLFKILKPCPFITQVFVTHYIFSKYTDKVMTSASLQNFIMNNRSSFDLVISEDFRVQPFYMFAHKFNAPLVTIMPFGGAHWMNNYMSNPLNLQYVGHEFLPYSGQLTLLQRFQNVVYTFLDLISKKYVQDPYNDAIAQKYFGHLRQPLPTVSEMERNISLVLTNSHFSMDTVTSKLPNMVEIAGIHIKPAKELPSDLKKIMDNAKHGVIYFSMGTILKSKNLPKEKRDALLNAFRGLEQTVLWKWEDENLPGRPKNVIIRKWFPQSDILAHQNIRLFITHGGLLSTQEAVSRGVPIVGIPIFGDQPRNILKATHIGFAEGLNYNNLTEENIKDTINKVLNNSSYNERVKELSVRFNDKPMSSMDTAIYWIEYVMRHRGAYYMKTPTPDMCWIQYYLLDVTLILIFIAMLLFYAIYVTIKYMYSYGCNRNLRKEKFTSNTKID